MLSEADSNGWRQSDKKEHKKVLGKSNKDSYYFKTWSFHIVCLVVHILTTRLNTECKLVLLVTDAHVLTIPSSPEPITSTKWSISDGFHWPLVGLAGTRRRVLSAHTNRPFVPAGRGRQCSCQVGVSHGRGRLAMVMSVAAAALGAGWSNTVRAQEKHGHSMQDLSLLLFLPLCSV